MSPKKSKHDRCMYVVSEREANFVVGTAVVR